MATNLQTRSLFFSLFGIISLVTTLGSSAPLTAVPAAQVTNDIAISMSEDHNSLSPGGQLTFTVRLINHGPDDATFVDVGFNLPAQLTMVSMSCDLGISPDSPFCEYSSLPAGATVVSRLVATITPGTRLHARLVKISSMAQFENPGVFDPQLRNNTASVRLRLLGKTAAP